jgi:hypothetical protein
MTTPPILGPSLTAALAGAKRASDRAYAMSLAALETGDPDLRRFLLRVRHLATRGGGDAVWRAACLEPEGSSARRLADTWPDPPRVRPVASTRPGVAQDPCALVIECAQWWGLAGPVVSPDGGVWVHASALAPAWEAELGDSDFFGSTVVCSLDLEAGTVRIAARAGQFRDEASVIAVSPDGAHLAVRHHRELGLLATATEPLARSALARGPNGEGPYRAAFVGSDRIAWLDASALVMSEVPSGARLASIDTVGTHALAVVPPGDRLAVGCAPWQRTRDLVWLHAVDDLRVVQKVPLPGEPTDPSLGHAVTAIACARDGAFLAMAVGRRTVHRFDLDTGAYRWSADDQAEIACALVVDGDRLLACGLDDGSISLWDVETGRHVARWTGHHGAVVGLAERPGQLLSGSDDGTLRQWTLPSASPEIVDGERGWAPPMRLSSLSEMPSQETRSLHRGSEDTIVARVGSRVAAIRQRNASIVDVTEDELSAELPQRLGATFVKRCIREDGAFLFGVSETTERIVLEAPPLALGLVDERTAAAIDAAGHVTIFEIRA